MKNGHANKGSFVYYSEKSRRYKIWVTTKSRIEASRDVVFYGKFDDDPYEDFITS